MARLAGFVQTPHRAAQKQASVEMATATPNGNFSSAGLSREISGLARSPKEKKPCTSTTRLPNVSFTRRVRIISTIAISPDTRTLPSNTNKNKIGPRKAPTAPINFQSPAPSARIKTSGSNRIRANPAPPSDALAPAHPEIEVRSPSPRKKAGTVSQLGILWVRKSTIAASRVTPMVEAQIRYCTFMGKDGRRGPYRKQFH